MQSSLLDESVDVLSDVLLSALLCEDVLGTSSIHPAGYMCTPEDDVADEPELCAERRGENREGENERPDVYQGVDQEISEREDRRVNAEQNHCRDEREHSYDHHDLCRPSEGHCTILSLGGQSWTF